MIRPPGFLHDLRVNMRTNVCFGPISQASIVSMVVCMCQKQKSLVCFLGETCRIVYYTVLNLHFYICSPLINVSVFHARAFKPVSAAIFLVLVHL